MVFFTSNLKLPSLTDNEPENLLKVNDNIKVRDNKSNKKSRLMRDIIKDIEEDNLTNISLIEWVYLLFNKTEWDKNNPDKSATTSQNIWQFAQVNHQLRFRLFWRLVINHFYPERQVLTPSLMESFTTFKPSTKKGSESFKIINFLFQSNYEELAKLSCQLYLQPNQLFSQYSLPYKFNLEDNLTLVETIQILIPIILKNSLNNKQVVFLIETLNILENTAQLKAVENLLLNLNSAVGCNYPNLVAWLKNNYSITGNNSLWLKLSLEAKNSLKQWMGAVNYKDFEKLVDSISYHLSYLLEEANSYDEKQRIKSERNQLISRKVFWSNYSDRFERIRILLPISSINIFGNKIETQEILTLKDDGSEATEVCIFDFDKWFIVEFFRGKGSETRIFAKSNELEDLLFNSNNISLKKLRNLSIREENIHDHKFCWQNYCEKLLRSKSIFPNINTKYFKIVEYKQGFIYSFATGMPPLSYQQIDERNRKLFYWKREIKELEKEAQEYIQNNEYRNLSQS